jgi:hypothetical protein
LESFGGRGRDEDFSPPTGSLEAVARLRRVGQGNAGPARPVRSFFAHVLALPVTTEIARVRGVYGYQLPKWLTGIDLSIGADVGGHRHERRRAGPHVARAIAGIS